MAVLYSVLLTSYKTCEVMFSEEQEGMKEYIALYKLPLPR